MFIRSKIRGIIWVLILMSEHNAQTTMKCRALSEQFASFHPACEQSCAGQVRNKFMISNMSWWSDRANSNALRLPYRWRTHMRAMSPRHGRLMTIHCMSWLQAMLMTDSWSARVLTRLHSAAPPGHKSTVFLQRQGRWGGGPTELQLSPLWSEAEEAVSVCVCPTL